MAELKEHLNLLENALRAVAPAGSVSIAYSGGLDSRFLSFFALQKGFDVEALTVAGDHVSAADTKEALDYARDMGLTVRLVRPKLPAPTELAAAGRSRCYVCKKAIFSALLEMASHPLCEGSNASDALVFRPGERAVRELGVVSPLMTAGLTKPMIREAAKELGLKDSAQAARPCLLTRFDYDDAPDAARLALTGRAEDFLSGFAVLKAGFRLRWIKGSAQLHVKTNPLLTDEASQEIYVALASTFPELSDTKIVPMDSLSGWFDRAH